MISSQMFRYVSCIRYNHILKILEEIRFPNAIIKGEPLSCFAYGSFGKRISSDIDILIAKKHIGNLENILNKHGFKYRSISREEQIIVRSFSHQLCLYSKKIELGTLFVDVNFDIFWGEYEGKRVDISKFLSDTIEMDIYGCKVMTLPPLKTMIQLILHHYKEMNSIYHLAGHNCINYNMFKDVYNLWKNNQRDISLEKIYAVSSEYEIIPYVFYILYFTNLIFKDTGLQRYVDAFRTSEGESLLGYYGLAEKERKLWKVDFRTRLETENLYELIRNDLTEDDINKLERNRKIFG